MALENKKSLLQPESVEAQQYRLQNSRLAARVEQTISTGDQQSSAGRPSVLAPSTPPTPLPAESSTNTTATLPGGSATPATIATTSETVGTTPSVPTSEVIYSDRAADFDGSFFFTASNPDLGFDVPSGSYQYAVMFKPDTFQAGHTQTIFHTYSGSFASSSIELSLGAGGDLQLRYQHNGGYIRYRTPHRWYASTKGKSGNGYTLFTFNEKPNLNNLPFSGYLPTMNMNANPKATQVKSQYAYLVNTGSFNIANNDHFSIGGTAARTGTNFSGSIAFICFSTEDIGRDNYLGLRDGTKGIEDVVNSDSFTDIVRAYEFNTTGAVEHTGSLATVQVPLGLSGSYAHVASYK